MSPRNLSPSITIATRPRSNTSNKLLMLAVGGKCFQVIGHRRSHRIVKMSRIVMHFHQHVGFIDKADGAPARIDHRQLRHIRIAHPLERGQQGVIRPDR